LASYDAMANGKVYGLGDIRRGGPFPDDIHQDLYPTIVTR
jgi:hypothetical protein